MNGDDLRRLDYKNDIDVSSLIKRIMIIGIIDLDRRT